jgi:preprotein translocase subunit SecG
MDKFIFIIHIFLSICIIVIVLFQRGKGSEAGAAMGGSISDNLFGAHGTNTFFSRLTFFLLFLFIISSLILSKEIILNKKSVDFNIDTYVQKINYEKLDK